MARYPIKYLGPKYSKGDTGEDLSIWYPGAKYPIGSRETKYSFGYPVAK